jgi:hypothetical protein
MVKSGQLHAFQSELFGEITLEPALAAVKNLE